MTKGPAAVLSTRLAKLAAARFAGTQARRPRYVAGLIPQASGTMPADKHQTLGRDTGLDRATRHRTCKPRHPRAPAVGTQARTTSDRPHPASSRFA
jgi:hypothetical protein